MATTTDAPARLALVAIAAAPLHLCVTVLASLTLRGLAGAALAALAWTALSLSALTLVARSRRLRVAVALALGLCALDLAMAAVIPYGTPWRSPAWILSRTAALALAGYGASGVALPPSLARASRRMGVVVLSAGALLGALYVVEVVNCLRQARGDPERRVDTAVVLGFGLLDGGRPSPVFVARIAKGVELHRRGLAARVLFTGGVGTHGPAESAAAMEVARAMGLPDASTLFEDRSHTTRENMTEAARVLRERGLALGPVAIVSDTFHLARARRLARDAGLDPVMVAAVTPAWTDRRRAAWWVLRESALLVADDVLRAVRPRFGR